MLTPSTPSGHRIWAYHFPMESEPAEPTPALPATGQRIWAYHPSMASEPAEATPPAPTSAPMPVVDQANTIVVE